MILRHVAPRVLVGAVAFLIAACPQTEDGQKTPPKKPAQPVPIVPQWYLDAPTYCTEQFDRDGDGTFEQRLENVLDANKNIVRKTNIVDNNGATEEISHFQDDIWEHDSETVTFNAAGVAVSYENHHYFFEDGRFVRDIHEASDARFLIATYDYGYDAEGRMIEVLGESANESIIRSRLITYAWDGDDLIEEAVDLGIDGEVDSLVSYSYEDLSDGRRTTVDTIDDSGHHVEVQTADTFGSVLHYTYDEDADGAAEYEYTVILEDGKFVGTELDTNGDGIVDQFSSQVYDDATQSVSITVRDAGNLPIGASEFTYGCWSEPVYRGPCSEPYVDTEPFGCARFRAAPALEDARAGATLTAAGTSLLVVDGTPSFELGPILHRNQSIDVDSDVPERIADAPQLCARATAVFADGRVFVAGGVVGGDAQTDVRVIELDGTSAPFGTELLQPRFLAHAGVFPDGAVLVAGGVTAAGALSELLTPSTAGTANFPGTLAPFHATLTVLDEDHALYLGGDDGTANPAASDSGAVFSRADNLWTVFASGQARTRHAALALGDGRAFIVGGLVDDEAIARVDIYDVASGIVRAADLPRALYLPALVALPDGRVLAAGGNSILNGDVTGTDETFVYDIDADTWVAGPHLTIPRGEAAAIVLDDGRVVVVGGTVHEGEATSAVDVLEIAP